MAILKLCHTNNPTPDQKSYREHVKEMRTKDRPSSSQSDNDDSSNSDRTNKEREREPNLTRCTNKYDLKLFQEAQTIASETIVSNYYICYIL